MCRADRGVLSRRGCASQSSLPPARLRTPPPETPETRDRARSRGPERAEVSSEGRGDTGLLRWLRDRLVEPRLAGIDLDSDERITVHRRILLEKRMFQGVMREFYQLCMDLDTRYLAGDGDRVELGAGTSLFKHFFPGMISTDVKAAPQLDRVTDALHMPFPD